MILTSCVVVSFCGVEFVGEIAEPEFFAGGADCSEPFAFALAERDASVARIGI